MTQMNRTMSSSVHPLDHLTVDLTISSDPDDAYARSRNRNPHPASPNAPTPLAQICTFDEASPPRITLVTTDTADAGMSRFSLDARGICREGLLAAVIKMVCKHHCGTGNVRYRSLRGRYRLVMDIIGYRPLLDWLAIYIKSGSACEELARLLPADDLTAAGSPSTAEEVSGTQSFLVHDDPQISLILHEYTLRRIHLRTATISASTIDGSELRRFRTTISGRLLAFSDLRAEIDLLARDGIIDFADRG